MAYKASVHLIEDCKFEDKNLIIKIENNNFILNNYFGPKFSIGRFCILVLNSKNIPFALYLLDKKDVPFQVYGDLDIFFEDFELIDCNLNDKKKYDYAKQICIFAFSKLAIFEIEQNKKELLSIENIIYKNVLNNNFGWKKNKKNIIDILSNFELDINIMNKIINSIKVCPMPKAALCKNINIDLSNYFIN